MVLRASAPAKQMRAAVSNDIVVCSAIRSPLTCASVVISNGSCACAGIPASAQTKATARRAPRPDAAHLTVMLGAGGAAMPLPMWKLGCGGWLYAVFCQETATRYIGSCISV